MKFVSVVNQYDIQQIKEFPSLEALNNYYGFHIKEDEKFPLMKENVQGIYAYMLINRID